MNARTFSRRAFAVAIALFAAPSFAQPQQVRPPIAHYWMDLANHSIAGMPEMPDMPAMPGMPGMGGTGGPTHWGLTRSMSPGRFMDLALYTKAKPAGSDASHAIPPALRMGSSLDLVPVRAEPKLREPGDPDEAMQERPTGRVLIYWGCGETVRAGQPRVIDLAGNIVELGRAFSGRMAPDRGARVGPGYSLWPNERNRVTVPRGASAAGSHAISGEGVPEGLRFAIGAAHDLMPAIDLSSTGTLATSIALRWPVVANAHGYYLHAMASAGNDLILWSSAETPDTGMGLFDYLSPPTIARWITDRVLLPATQTACAVPAGIFATAKDSAMLRMIAYGGELNLVHPPRPADPRTVWEQQWTVRVRTKSSTMAMLGEQIDARSQAGSTPSGMTQAGGPMGGAQGAPREAEQPAAGPIPGLPGINPGGILRGIFGR
ncbi:MAG: hypothetical protein KJZ83_17880 [Burkholderiaceae bacterium]|nr:hypothetical protein [Burkholderiaceae bacterium]